MTMAIPGSAGERSSAVCSAATDLMNGSHDWWITPTVTALVIGLVLATPAVAASPGEERAKAHAKFVEERGKAHTKAIEEDAKGRAKLTEERAKGLPKAD